MIKCPGCGAPLSDDEPVCSTCGAVMEGDGPRTTPKDGDAEDVPSTEPRADGDVQEKACPICGALNPAGARFCVRCRHSFDGTATFFGIHWLVVPAVLLVLLVVASAMALSAGLVGGFTGEEEVDQAAQAGADGTARQVLLQDRTVTTTATVRELVITRNVTATPIVTPTRTVDPNATPWNAALGAGINHTEGGTHHVELSPELARLRRAAHATPTPFLTGYGDGSGHATGPLSWVGTGNWSPGFIDLPAGDGEVVLLSQGTTAFVLVDEADERAGFGIFPPPGGRYTVPIPEAGRYVIAFGTANTTDSWSASILPPGDVEHASPPVPTPNMQVFTYAGTGGGSPGTFNLTPGTVQLLLHADTMTMAYLKDQWGVTLSTIVAGPNDGGATVAIPRTGTYRLDVWGTGTWSVVVTWVAADESAGPTLPTVDPSSIVTTLTPVTIAPTSAATTASTVQTR